MFDGILTPTAPPTPSQYQIQGLTVHPQRVTIQIKPDIGEMLTFHFSGNTADNFITMMNTGDHSTTSLGRKILQYLNDNGYLAGTVT